MTKSRAGSQNRESDCQFDSLTLDQKKSGIDPIYLAAGDVRHTVGKLLTRATNLLQTASRSELYTRSYVPSKSRESQLAGFRDSHAGVPGVKIHLDVGSLESHRIYYMGEGGGFPRVRAVVSLVCPSARGLSEHPRVSRNVN
jgi:hypothetical protein